jgi:hypothetical protein
MLPVSVRHLARRAREDVGAYNMTHVDALKLIACFSMFGCTLVGCSAGDSPSPSNTKGPQATAAGGGGDISTAGPASTGGTSGSGAAGDGVPLPMPTPDAAPVRGSCGLDMPAFCDDFEVPSPGGRGGDLDEKEWSVARIDNAMNPTQGQLDAWPPTTTSACGKENTGVVPDNDYFFCAGGSTPSMHLNNSYDDHEMFTIQSFRIRRPFDFANRTGVIAFDVGAKSQIPGGHGWWFNVFISQDAGPIPYQEANAEALYVKAGIGFEFEGAFNCESGGGAGVLNAVSNIFLEENYAITHTYGWNDIGPAGKHEPICFKTQEEVMNHLEIHISQTKVQVLASDAGDPQSLRVVAEVDNVNLPLSQGYVSFQHTHYNAHKSGLPVAYTTYHWDNIGFDGPTYPTPRAYDVPDSLTPLPPNGFAGLNVGYQLGKDSMSKAPITLANVDLTGATSAALNLNAGAFMSGDEIGYRFNGGTWRSYPHSFPTSDQGGRVLSIPVDLADLMNGNNTLEMKSKSGFVTGANMDLTVEGP